MCGLRVSPQSWHEHVADVLQRAAGLGGNGASGHLQAAQRAIRDLIELTPDIARVVDTDGAEREVGLESIRVGQVVRVRPGENLPVDGKVVRGQTSINQASLTGEAVPIEAAAGTSLVVTLLK